MHNIEVEDEVKIQQSNSVNLTQDQRNLETDIIEINNQLTSIQKQTKSIERAIEALHKIISDGSLPDAKAKANVYRTINELRITLSNFIANTSKVLDLKFKYRTQQATIKFNLIKNVQDDQTTDITKMMTAIQQLSVALASDGADAGGNSEALKQIENIKSDLDSHQEYTIM